MKKTILSLLILMGGCFAASAQEAEQTKEVFNPHWFVGAQMGAQETLGEIKTSKFVQILDNLKAPKALVVTKDKDEKVVLSARNIPTVKTTMTNSLNVYDILKYDSLVLTKDAVAAIEEVYA